MRAIIIRPFGTQQQIDFDRVEETLVGPALKRLGITDFATIDYLKQGNVPMDMFQPLLAADLVVADLSIHNANVLYQLGIRETLRDKRTLLLYARGQEHSLDPQTDQYFTYDNANPAASLDHLVALLRRTMGAPDREFPKFRPLSDLEAAVPRDFRAEVERAVVDQQPGDLELLTAETKGLDWEDEGMRLIGGAEQVLKTTAPARVLLFTGHMIDAPDRAKPRFPPDKEDLARQRIKDTVAGELKLWNGIAYGLAGGASGGDILFHEVCAELDIRTRLYLAVPRDEFVAASVQPGGPVWVERFDRLYRRLPVRVLAQSKELPGWLRDKPDYSIWQRNNLWMLHNSLVQGAENLTLIALWDGELGDGPGGTGDLVEQARRRGAKTVVVDTKELFGLAPSIGQRNVVPLHAFR